MFPHTLKSKEMYLLNKKCLEAAKILIETCGGCKQDEKIAIITDDSSLELAKIMWAALEAYPQKTLVLMPDAQMHGEDTNDVVGNAMLHADVIFGCTKFSLTHAPKKKIAVQQGARFVNMADYDMSMMEDGGLHADFHEMKKLCLAVGEKIKDRSRIEITTPRGSHYTASIEGRAPFMSFGMAHEPGTACTPPCVMCSTCAVEGTGEGVVYLDGSVIHPSIGLVTDAIKLTIHKGLITDITGGPQAQALKELLTSFHEDAAFNVGEIGIGLNTKCKLRGRMLEDEGCGGTVHFGIGDNRGFGGHMACSFHLDAVFCEPTLLVDGTPVLIDGKIIV